MSKIQITSKARVKFHKPKSASHDDHFVAEPTEKIHSAPAWIKDTHEFAFYTKHGVISEVATNPSDDKPSKPSKPARKKKDDKPAEGDPNPDGEDGEDEGEGEDA